MTMRMIMGGERGSSGSGKRGAFLAITVMNMNPQDSVGVPGSHHA
jgi:hypothetical protein